MAIKSWTDHVATGSSACEEHVRRNLSEDITHEQNTDAGLVLC
jgi:hypothetical protein